MIPKEAGRRTPQMCERPMKISKPTHNTTFRRPQALSRDLRHQEIGDLRNLARALGGEVYGRSVSAPGPGHSPRDRSLSVTISPFAPDGFLCFSHSGDPWQLCRDHVRQRLGLPGWRPGDEQDRRVADTARFDQAAINQEAEDRSQTEDDQARIKRALDLWNEAVDPRGTLVEQYLTARCLRLPHHLAGSLLRFHPHCPWRNEDTGRTDHIPALIAAFRAIDTGDIVGIHRIRLDRPEQWPRAERRMLGFVRRAAVMLGAPTADLSVGEGVETCMAAELMGIAPAWAMGSAGMIAKLPVIDGVMHLSILMETGNASEQAARHCARRWMQAGRRVTRIRPTVAGASDMNDLLMIEGAQR